MISNIIQKASRKRTNDSKNKFQILVANIKPYYKDRYIGSNLNTNIGEIELNNLLIYIACKTAGVSRSSNRLLF